MNSIKPESQTIQPRIATIILLSIILIAAIIVLLWAAGVGVIEDIFAYLNLLQEQPPIWVEAPMTMSQFILAPTVIFFLTAITITRVSPQPRTWSRVLVISILLLLTIRYLLWRSLSTLNLSSPLNGTFSIALLVLEFLTIFSASLQLFLMLKVKNRQGEAEELAVQVINKSFNPTVDILIPTYDEPAFILKKTIILYFPLNLE